MIISYIDIEDYMSVGFPEKNKELLSSSETTEDTNKLVSSETIEHAEKDGFSTDESSLQAEQKEQSNEGFMRINRSSRFFGDTFELRYLQHKQKNEKERIVRESLADKL